MTGTLTVDGWAVTFGTARRGMGAAGAPPSTLFAVQNVTAHPSTSVRYQLHIIRCGTIITCAH